MTNPRTTKTKAAASKLVATAKTTTKANDKRVAINVHIPIALHRRFRVAALEADMTLADAVIDAMDKWVRGQR